MLMRRVLELEVDAESRAHPGIGRIHPTGK